MKTVRCNYCGWVGQEPSPAEFDTLLQYQTAYLDFRDSHDNPDRNICPAKAETPA